MLPGGFGLDGADDEKILKRPDGADYCTGTVDANQMSLSPSLTWRPPPAVTSSVTAPTARGTTQAPITRFITATPSRPVIRQERSVVVSLFDGDGMALEPWLHKKYTCIGYQHSDKPREHKTRTYRGGSVTVCNLHNPVTISEIVERHQGTVAFACAMPPSKDLSVAGARHWKRKRENDPQFQEKAAGLVAIIERAFLDWDCPYYISNPATSQLGRLLRTPNHTYQPHEFGGYLNPNDTHPLYPEYIPVQDAYTQHQGLWTGGGFRMPIPKPVQPTWKYFISKRKGAGGAPAGMRRMSPVLYSNWNARGARASTPRGFSRALCQRLHA